MMKSCVASMFHSVTLSNFEKDHRKLSSSHLICTGPRQYISLMAGQQR